MCCRTSNARRATGASTTTSMAATARSSSPNPATSTRLARWFVQSLQAQGEPYNPDFNGPNQRGVGYFQFTYEQGQRCSAAYAFIAPIENDPNLTLKLEAKVQKIIIENGLAVGVVYKQGAGVFEARTDGEIILSAGAYITPKIMMLSGLGPADHLTSHGIDVIEDLPGVGQNLNDHPDVSIVARANGPHGYDNQDSGWIMIRNGLQFRLFGTSPITTTSLEAARFVNPTDPDAPPTHRLTASPSSIWSRRRLGLKETATAPRSRSSSCSRTRVARSSWRPPIPTTCRRQHQRACDDARRPLRGSRAGVALASSYATTPSRHQRSGRG